MSGSKQITVTRNYQAAPEHCLRALELLLKKPVNHEGSPSPATLGNDGKVEEASADESSIRQ